ncbi:MAG: hypothetical protein OXI93_14680 [Bryobacterales bacterium]|nr:hypothetical protein [Bryobacterales bacterium]
MGRLLAAYRATAPELTAIPEALNFELFGIEILDVERFAAA